MACKDCPPDSALKASKDSQKLTKAANREAERKGKTEYKRARDATRAEERQAKQEAREAQRRADQAARKAKAAQREAEREFTRLQRKWAQEERAKERAEKKALQEKLRLQRQADREASASENKRLRAIKAQETATKRLADQQMRAAATIAKAAAASAAKAQAAFNRNMARTGGWGNALGGGGGHQAPPGFRPNAGAQIAAIFAQQQGALPPLPVFPPQPPAQAPGNWTIPRQSLMTRARNWFHARTGVFVGQRGPPGPPRPSLLRRGIGAMDAGVDRLIGFRKDVQKAQRGDALDKLSMILKGRPGAVAGAAVASGLTATLGAVGGAIGVVKKAFFATWDYIDSKVLPTTSTLNRMLGTTTTGMKGLSTQAISMGMRFERLGLGFEQGARMVGQLGEGLRTALISPRNLDTLSKISEYVGVGAEDTAAMARSFEATGGSIEEFRKHMVGATVAAQRYSVPVNIIRRAFAQYPDLVQRWGTQNSKQFIQAIALAESYGLHISKVEASFGRTMDSFETAASSVSTFNQVFHTSLDTISVMNASSTERLEMFRNALKNVGVQWDTIDKFRKNLLTSTLQLSEADAAAAFGSQKQRQEALKRAAAEKKIVDGEKEWRNALSSLGTQLTSIEQLTNNFFRAIGEVVAKLLGFKSGIDGTKEGVKGFEKFMDRLTGKIRDFAKGLPDQEGGAGGQFLSWIDNAVTSLGDMKEIALEVIEIFEGFTTFGSTLATDDARRFAQANSLGKQGDRAIKEISEDIPFMSFAQVDLMYKQAARRMHVTPEAAKAIMQQAVDREEQRRALRKNLGYTDEPPTNAPSNIPANPMWIPEVHNHVYVGGEQVATPVSRQTVRKSMGVPGPNG